MPTFDYSALRAPLDRAAVARLRTRSIADKVKPSESEDVFFFGMLVFFLGLDAIIITLVSLGPLKIGSYFTVPLLLFYLLFGGLGLVFVAMLPLAIYRLVVRWGEFYRAEQFAAANTMTYAVSEPRPTWDGLLFSMKVDGARAASVFTATGLPVFEAGNYHYHDVVRGKQRETHWGYIVADLGAPSSSFVLRSKSRLSAQRWALGAYAKNAILSLGSDADKTFTLYCPAGSEDEARQIFTPQLISELRAIGRSVDVEVKGSFLFVYSCKPFRFPRPAVVTNAFAVISTVTSRLTAAG